MEELYELATIKDVFDYITKTYPTWFVNMCDSYSHDYDFLNDNWATLSTAAKSQKQKVLIVDNLTETNFLLFSELLTKVGFVVRTKDEFIACAKCNLALPKIGVYNKLKEVQKPVPAFWKETCSSC
jgi:hypothetical protein